MESALGRLPRVAVLRLSRGGVTLRLGSNFLWVGDFQDSRDQGEGTGLGAGKPQFSSSPRQHLGILTNLTSFVLFLYV